MKYIDCHTHAHFEAYKDDMKEVIARALAADTWLVNVGTDKETSRQAVAVAEAYPEGVYATVGLHPTHSHKSFHDPEESATENTGEDFDYAYYKALAEHPKSVAIGECGLDYFRMDGDIEHNKKRQKEAFEMQIALSKETARPLMIHCRDAFMDLIPMLSYRKAELNPEPGIIHFFTGTIEEAKQLMELGFSFTFGGSITFPPRKGEDGHPLHKIIQALPSDRILTETDAPYLAPVPYRGKRNEPSYVVEVVKKMAELRGVTLAEMASVIAVNARRVLKLPS
jgi:TatD DNase family protein